MSDAIRKKYAADIEEARKLGNQYDPDVYGRFPWDRSERRGKTTRLSKASLGEFTYAVLKGGGKISCIWPFQIQYKNCAVFYRVWLTIAQKKKLEEETEYRFDPPPTATLC